MDFDNPATGGGRRFFRNGLQLFDCVLNPDDAVNWPSVGLAKRRTIQATLIKTYACRMTSSSLFIVRAGPAMVMPHRLEVAIERWHQEDEDDEPHNLGDVAFNKDPR